MPDPVIPVCAVNVRMYRQDGLADSGARVTATLNAYEVYNGFVVPRQEIGVTDADGLCVLSLFPNELGSVESSYTVKLVGTNGKSQALTAVVPNVSEAELENCIVLPPFPGKVDGQLALEAVLQVGEEANQAAVDAQNAATDSQTAAANSASSQTAASNSEVAAGNSANAAGASASAASSSATAASGSASAAATSASAASTSASDAASTVASISPSTIVRTSSDQTLAGIKTFSSTIVGSINGNAGTVTNGLYTTGDQSIGGAKTFTGQVGLPSWTTAGRPGTPTANSIGRNTDLGCIEYWDNTLSLWVQEGWQTGAEVALSGTSGVLSGVPAWAKEVHAFVRQASHNSGSNQRITFQAGDTGGLVTSGYLGGYSNMSGADTGALTTFISSSVASAAAVLGAAQLVCRRSGSLWQLQLGGNYTNGTGFVAHATCPLNAPISQVGWAYTSGSADDGFIQLAWRK